jgi:hypothetical protein
LPPEQKGKMNRLVNHSKSPRHLLPALLLGGAILASSLTVVTADQASKVLPRKSNPHGKSYGEWSAAWWQWALGLPVAGHPFVDGPGFNISAGQTGDVWFLGAPTGPAVVRTGTIPTGTSLFFGLLNSEWSDLEGFATEADQRAVAELFTDHITGLFCTVDGVAVANLGSYRVASAQFTFTAPSPWIFRDTGGTGHAVNEGYYLFLAPLSTGSHVIHYGGAFHFSIAEGDDFDLDAPIDITYNLTVR